MVRASAQGAAGTGPLCDLCGEKEEAARCLVCGGPGCSKPFRSACTRTSGVLGSGRTLTGHDILLPLQTAEQSGSRAPNPARHKTFVVRGVPQHKGTHHLWCRSKIFSIQLFQAFMCPALGSAQNNLCPWAGASLSSAPYPGETAFPAGVLPIRCRPPP